MKKTGRMTVADLLELRGKRQLAMLRVETLEEAEAAERAGIHMVSVPPHLMLKPAFRDAAPSVFAIPGADFFEIGTTEDFVRWAFGLYKAGADAVYCSASLHTIRRLADEGIPVCGHAGLIPAKATWTGGFRAVGKTLETAQLVWRQVRKLEEAGAFAAEIEVVPEGIATEISRRTSLFMISMGSGAGCDAQYLFSEDVLGANTGHIPRHAKTYRNFAAEYARLQEERIGAYREFAEDVRRGAYPEARHGVAAGEQLLSQFRHWLDDQQAV
ncbi:3-methyl-2-oxobutanoate hydroxymethyltransferase [Chelativorans sp. AA-79]|uniref:3-methyl-2-oxobutanoate hydroxymethyltransferase n=1 Tax=Chelativorans sp. AA-79 TaxID=3028735 RepID=UPI0023F982B5|nr:3-methyl-2-oxobutanoate hydroxymethyltransferase [Chelativorans sp. AA-79]WEX08399.1 3-methyl-2-oxobutanoate hydroxymethyltransferase [Chelativorans sp. AA-79]